MDQILILTILLASTALLSVVSSSDVGVKYEDLNITCIQHSCAQKPNPLIYKFCRCDEDCAKYGDCCLDSPYISQTEEGMRDWHCFDVGFVSGVYLINKCPPDWTDPKIRSLCQTSNQDAKPEGKFLRGTIVVEGERAIYRNYYCALCNNDISKPKFWDVGFNCPDLYPSTIRELSKNIMHYMKYNDELEKWGVWLRLTGKNVTVFSQCTPGYSPRENKLIRNCYRNMIQKCDKNFPDKKIIEKCDRYTANVFDDFTSRRYKNPHCAMCTYNEIFEGNCKGIYETYPSPGVKSFQILMQFNTAQRQTSKCNDNTVYDESLRRCQSFMCQDGYVLRGKTCAQNTKNFRPSFGGG